MKEQFITPQTPEHFGNPMQNDDSDRIAVDGFQQVLEMLKIADPVFRESLLKRLAHRDRQLAQELRKSLASFGI